MKEIKIGELVNQTINKTNKQISFNLKARKLKKFGVTPEQLLQVTFIKPKKFKVKSKRIITNSKNGKRV